MEKPYEKGSFSFRYSIEDVKKALSSIFATKNDYSWKDHEITIVLGLELECRLLEKEGETQILLSAAESATLGLYKKPTGKPKKKIDKKTSK